MAGGVGNQAGEIIQGVLEQHGAPVDLVQWVKGRTNRRKTQRFMSHPDVGLILATGGPSMVRAAYSSGHARDRRRRRQRAGVHRRRRRHRTRPRSS